MKFLLLVLLFILFSVQTIAQDLSIVSTPEKANVMVQLQGNDQFKNVGKTPFKDSLKSFLSTYVGKNSFILTIEKEGYEPYKMLFTKNKDVDIDISVKLEVSKAISTVKKHDVLVSDLFKVQKMIRSKNFDGAISRLDELAKDHKHFSIIPELKGIAHYLNKDIERSLSMYREAFGLNPKNVDAYKMKVYLEKKLGVSP